MQIWCAPDVGDVNDENAVVAEVPVNAAKPVEATSNDEQEAKETDGNLNEVLSREVKGEVESKNDKQGL